FSAIKTAASGLQAQAQRLAIVTQNIANKDIPTDNANKLPYLKKRIFFKNELDRKTGANTVKAYRISDDTTSPLNLKWDPTHPAARPDGYLTYPNINETIEIADFAEAKNSYNANLNVLSSTKNIILEALKIISDK
ncbi:MAG: flagellar basal body rod protein FlgC, partial [Anaplasmataceae bacterium]|nr:flagellar basal body rod protein FlgC [Anaplasmataceae bacterium]